MKITQSENILGSCLVLEEVDKVINWRYIFNMHTSCVINRRTKIECIPFKPIQRKEIEYKSVKKGRKDVRKEKERGSETENKKLDNRNKYKYISDNNRNK